MKNTPPTRWSCRIVQYALVHAGSDSLASRLAARHFVTCTDCARQMEQADRFDAALRRDAIRQTQAPAGGLDLRIIRSLEASTRPSQPRRPVFRPVIVLAGAAAAIAVGIFTWRSTRVVAPTGPRIVDPTATALVAHHGTDTMATAARPAAPVTDLLKQNPLQVEVDSVYADARSAVQFLALNFLPSDAAQTRHAAADSALGG